MILFSYDKINLQYINTLKKEIEDDIIVKNIKDDIDSNVTKAEIIVGFGNSLKYFTEEMIEQFKHLKWIHMLTAGVETIPFEILQGKDILLTNSRGIHGTQMAEQIMGMMISFTRGLHINLRNQLISHWSTGNKLNELYGKTLCIIGCGAIGRELARKAKAFDLKTIGVKRNIEKLKHFDIVVPTTDIRNVLKESDFIVSLVPLTPDTFHLIGYKEFSVMKPTSVFLNFSRGDVVDEKAMIDSLRDGKIWGAGLDVFHKEPLPNDNPLWKMKNVLISPHNSGITSDIEKRYINLFKKNYAAFKEGKDLLNVVDLKNRY